MELSAGQTVLLKHTRERARVIRELGDGQWLLEAELDRERFPVHEDELEPVIGIARPKPVVTADVTPSGIRLLPDPDGPAVQLAFLPAGELDFQASLLNFSEETLVFMARLLTNRGQQWARHGVLAPASGVELGHLYRDLLNENAAVEVQVSRKADTGTDSMQTRAVKLKPKLFHKNTREVTWFPEAVTVFDVFAKARLARAPEPSLRAYTQQHAPPVEQLAARRRAEAKPDYGVQAAAEFSNELDLHIDKLTGRAEDLTPGEMLDIQLAHMRKYLEVAIRLGIDRVYLIHGKGKGALRNRIHAELQRMGDLEGFNNDYHPKYGYGATEVVLR